MKRLSGRQKIIENIYDLLNTTSEPALLENPSSSLLGVMNRIIGGFAASLTVEYVGSCGLRVTPDGTEFKLEIIKEGDMYKDPKPGYINTARLYVEGAQKQIDALQKLNGVVLGENKSLHAVKSQLEIEKAAVDKRVIGQQDVIIGQQAIIDELQQVIQTKDVLIQTQISIIDSKDQELSAATAELASVKETVEQLQNPVGVVKEPPVTEEPVGPVTEAPIAEEPLEGA